MSFHDDPLGPTSAPRTGYVTPDSGYTVQRGFGGGPRTPLPVPVIIASAVLFLVALGSLVVLVGRLFEYNPMVLNPLMANLWLVFKSGIIAVSAAAAAAVVLLGREWSRVFAIAVSGIVLCGNLYEGLFYSMPMFLVPFAPLTQVALALAALVLLCLPKVSTWHYEKRQDQNRSPFAPPGSGTQAAPAKPAAFHVAAVLLFAIGLLLLGYSAIQFVFVHFSFELWPKFAGVEFAVGISAIALGGLTFSANGIARLLAIAVAGATAWTGFDTMAVNVLYAADWGIYDGLYDVRYWIALVLLLLSAIVAAVLLVILASHRCTDWVHEQHAVKPSR